MKKAKSKKGRFPRWLALSLFTNCFNDGDLKHLGLVFRGVFYCITHSAGNGIIVSKKYLKMREISNDLEYFKKCTSKPTVLHKTAMYISEAFVVNAILSSELNKVTA